MLMIGKRYNSNVYKHKLINFENNEWEKEYI